MAGTVCMFLRFAGCNLWDGREESKAKSSCPNCDTDFNGGELLRAEAILKRVQALGGKVKWLVVTGGEPLLQYNSHLNQVLKEAGYKICLETNGTAPLDFPVDWVVMSPKTSRSLVKLKQCDDLKLLYPHTHATIDQFRDFPCRKKYLQPVESNDCWKKNIELTLNRLYSLEGTWKMSCQLHKYLNCK